MVGILSAQAVKSMAREKTTQDHAAVHSILKIDCMVNIMTGNELRDPR
jgi:hypothetical protein